MLAASPTILEGQELEDAVHDADYDGETKEVGVGLHQGLLGREGGRCQGSHWPTLQLYMANSLHSASMICQCGYKINVTQTDQSECTYRSCDTDQPTNQ